MKLLIGNKNYSSWSLRPWLVLTHFGIEFEEELLMLSGDNWKEGLVSRTPSGFVPVLEDDGLIIDETIAIIEYLADKYQQHRIWPKNIKRRAMARACSARMHAGFSALRNAAPMNLRGHHPGRVPLDEVSDNLCELEELLSPLLDASSGPFLFDDFCAADAMFAPVATRIETYRIPVSAKLSTYFEALLGHEAFQIWRKEALREVWIVDQDEIDFIQAQG